MLRDPTTYSCVVKLQVLPPHPLSIKPRGPRGQPPVPRIPNNHLPTATTISTTNLDWIRVLATAAVPRNRIRNRTMKHWAKFWHEMSWAAKGKPTPTLLRRPKTKQRNPKTTKAVTAVAAVAVTATATVTVRTTPMITLKVSHHKTNKVARPRSLKNYCKH